jgi:hypothetical protein
MKERRLVLARTSFLNKEEDSDDCLSTRAGAVYVGASVLRKTCKFLPNVFTNLYDVTSEKTVILLPP